MFVSIENIECSLVFGYYCIEIYVFWFFYIAAKIGEGILLDHGTGVVIGETAIVGNRVSLMHVSVFINFFYAYFSLVVL